MNKKKPSKLEKITKIVIWVMLISMLGSAVVSAIIAIMN